MGRNHLPKQEAPKGPPLLPAKPCGPTGPLGISPGFPGLSPSQGQLDYALLARPPLYSSCDFHVRLACLIHAANVRSEFIRWAMALPLGTTGSLWPTFVSARLVRLAVRQASAIALNDRFPTGLSLPSRASVTVWEATAPVKLPTMQGPGSG